MESQTFVEKKYSADSCSIYFLTDVLRSIQDYYKWNAGEGQQAALVKFMVYISKSYFHLWYLPMLIGLLIITPMLWEIVNSARGKQWEEYMIVLFLVFQILPYTINYFPLP